MSSPGRARTLAEVYRHFGEVEAGAGSPMYGRVAVAFSESAAALAAISTVPAHKRQPALILAALHDLALAGQAPALAEAYAAGDDDTAVEAAIDTMVNRTEVVVALVARRTVRTTETARCAVLYPAIAEAAHRAGAQAVGLIDVGSGAGLNVQVDRVGVDYSSGVSAGDPTSPVQVSCSVVGHTPVPTRPVPEVASRVVVDRDPIDVTRADDARWMRACVAPDQPERAARLEAELALASEAPPTVLRGDALALLPAAIDLVPTGVLPVVITTWALSRFSGDRRLRFRQGLHDAGAERTVVWVSAEGVGVAPGIPTLGDRPASGHSIIGLGVFEGSDRRTEAVGRCWSRGRLLSWLAASD
ncbi:MAG TPA: DUF2332 domain-containing protein [Propionibacteriaceae bacterium]